MGTLSYFAICSPSVQEKNSARTEEGTSLLENLELGQGTDSPRLVLLRTPPRPLDPGEALCGCGPTEQLRWGGVSGA
eukprot:scaffold260766_cov23-Tisochrysis_lutea.AAC.1